MKKAVFTLVAVALPLVLIGLIEGGLQLAGVDRYAQTAFWPALGQPDYMHLNKAYTARYFPVFEPGAAPNLFARRKAEGTFRVMVLGGSSAQGFPNSFPYAFPERLAERLRAAAPRQRIEVVNLGMSAVNSYTLWDLKDAVAAQEPDAVLIYAGHNEYYGAFGAGSSIYALGNRIGLKRLTLRLKRSILYTRLERLLVGAPDAETNPQREPGVVGRVMMARVVGESVIPQDGPIYHAGIDQFTSNLADIVATFRKADIPVYLGTLTSNLADQPPLGANPHAQAAFDEGQQYLAAGDTVTARTAFLQAKELDDLRFRAPEAFNEHLRATYAATNGVTVVDVQAAFRAASPSGLEGATLFDDHLHPNAQGYELMAATFFEALRRHPALDTQPMPLTFASFEVDPFEQAYAQMKVDLLLSGFPFNKTADVDAQDAAAQAVLRTYTERQDYITQQAVSANMGGLTVPEALNEALRYTRGRRDTLNTLLLFRALLPWEARNEQTLQQAVRYAISDATWHPHVAPLALFAASQTDAAFANEALEQLQTR